ncbi:SulP family inorganic anion transporter [Roseiflexus castenholzii]|uniref:SulP family inorganic anion transporter n=1 Tax=Roseiflexus castenholzii TaxID=120962 RepID=UPI003C7DCD3C
MLAALQKFPATIARPVEVMRGYSLETLRADLVAGVTVGLVLLPQALAFSLLAGLPPEMGLYSAIVASIIGALWGSSSHLHTGPTNTASLLTLSVILPLAAPGTPEFMALAGMLAVLAGALRLIFGLARLGLLVNFVSDSVAVGFTAGAGILIISNQIAPILRLDLPMGVGLIETFVLSAAQIQRTHLPSLLLGVATIALIATLQRLRRRLPTLLIALVVVSAIAWVLRLEESGVHTLGVLPQSLPPLAKLPLLDLNLIGALANGALAVAIIGLVEASAIARAIATHSQQRLDSNQEFIGQGLANICAGFFSGHPCSGSFNRSALSFQSGARTSLGNAFSGAFVLIAMFPLAPLIAHLPRPVLAGALAITAWSMVDHQAIRRIWRADRVDGTISLITLAATLFVPLQFAIISGVLMSLGAYLWRTSAPRVQSVLPDAAFRHWEYQPHLPVCPQLAVVDVLGDLYFGAVNHVEEQMNVLLTRNPTQRFLLLRMHSVQRCDVSGIKMLQTIVRQYRDRGGGVYFVRVRQPVRQMMDVTGFTQYVGADHFLDEDHAIDHLFHRVLDPAVCIYECEVRAFRECQNLPKRPLPPEAIPLLPERGAPLQVPMIEPRELWQQIRSPSPPRVIDVREPREYRQGHIPQAELLPLYELLTHSDNVRRDRPIVLACRSGRRSERAAAALMRRGFDRITILRGGMLAWEASDLLMAIGQENGG